MYTHEYSNKKFETWEDCRDDLMSEIDEEDIGQHIDLTVPDIIGTFLRNRNNVDFSVWFQEKIDEAIHYIEEEFIFEHDEDDD